MVWARWKTLFPSNLWKAFWPSCTTLLCFCLQIMEGGRIVLSWFSCMFFEWNLPSLNLRAILISGRAFGGASWWEWPICSKSPLDFWWLGSEVYDEFIWFWSMLRWFFWGQVEIAHKDNCSLFFPVMCRHCGHRRHWYSWASLGPAIQVALGACAVCESDV